MYNLTGLTGAQNIGDIVYFVNSSGSTNGSFGIMLLLSIAFILIFSFGINNFKIGIFVTSFIMFILSILLSILGIISLAVVVYFFLMLIASGMMILLTRSD